MGKIIFIPILLLLWCKYIKDKLPASSFSFSPSALYLTGIKFIFSEKKKSK